MYCKMFSRTYLYRLIIFTFVILIQCTDERKHDNSHNRTNTQKSVFVTDFQNILHNSNTPHEETTENYIDSENNMSVNVYPQVQTYTLGHTQERRKIKEKKLPKMYSTSNSYLETFLNFLQILVKNNLSLNVDRSTQLISPQTTKVNTVPGIFPTMSSLNSSTTEKLTRILTPSDARRFPLQDYKRKNLQNSFKKELDDPEQRIQNIGKGESIIQSVSPVQNIITEPTGRVLSVQDIGKVVPVPINHTDKPHLSNNKDADVTVISPAYEKVGEHMLPKNLKISNHSDGLESGTGTKIPPHEDTPTASHITTPTLSQIATLTSSQITTPTLSQITTPNSLQITTPTSLQLTTPTSLQIITPTSLKITTQTALQITTTPVSEKWTTVETTTEITTFDNVNKEDQFLDTTLTVITTTFDPYDVSLIDTSSHNSNTPLENLEGDPLTTDSTEQSTVPYSTGSAIVIPHTTLVSQNDVIPIPPYTTTEASEGTLEHLSEKSVGFTPSTNEIIHLTQKSGNTTEDLVLESPEPSLFWNESTISPGYTQSVLKNFPHYPQTGYQIPENNSNIPLYPLGYSQPYSSYFPFGNPYYPIAHQPFKPQQPSWLKPQPSQNGNNTKFEPIWVLIHPPPDLDNNSIPIYPPPNPIWQLMYSHLAILNDYCMTVMCPKNWWQNLTISVTTPGGKESTTELQTSEFTTIKSGTEVALANVPVRSPNAIYRPPKATRHEKEYATAKTFESGSLEKTPLKVPSKKRPKNKVKKVPKELAELAQNIESFAADIYLKLTVEKGNVIFSPLAMFKIINSLFNDRHPKRNVPKYIPKFVVFDNVRKIFKYRGNKMKLMSSMFYLHQQLEKGESYMNNTVNFKLNLVNEIFVPTITKIDQMFKNAIKKINVGIQNIDYKRKSDAKYNINKNIEKNSGGRFHQMLKNPFPVDTKICLVSAGTIEGKWAKPFSQENTYPDMFHADQTSRRVAGKMEQYEIDMMYQTGLFNYSENKILDAKFLELPYKSNGYSLTLVVPNNVNGLKKLETKQKLLNIFKEQLTETYVDVFVPKFSIQQTIINYWNVILKSIGLDILYHEKVVFPNIAKCCWGIRLSNLASKYLLQVTEAGTSIENSKDVSKSLPTAWNSFSANRPFLFFVRHKPTGTIVFIGRTSNIFTPS